LYRLFLALRYLRSRLVNLISVCGVMAGVAVLIVVTSVMDGFQEKVRATLRGTLSDIILTPQTASPRPFRDVAAELEADRRIVGASPQVAAILFYPYKSVRRTQFSLGDDREVLVVTVVGIDWHRERRVSAFDDYVVTPAEGDPFHHPDAEAIGWPTVIVSRTFAEKFRGLGTEFLLPDNLRGTQLDLMSLDWQEKTVTNPNAPAGFQERQVVEGSPRNHAMYVSGVYDAEDTSADVARMFVRMSDLREMTGLEDEYHEIHVKLKPDVDADALKAELQGKMFDFQVETWEDQRRQYLRAVNSEKVLLVIVLSFIVLLGGFIILATLTLTVVEKTRDIGVLNALGASRRGILSMFLTNGLLIGVIGSILGLVLGWLFTSNVNAVKDFLDQQLGIKIFPPDIYLFREIPTVWSWPTVAWIAGGSTAVAFLAGLLPALRAARMDPVKALRYE
jgi:lipoprotein-releasing system permease protein